MTAKHQDEDRDQPVEQQPTAPTTRSDLKGDAPAPKQGDTVDLRGPNGTRVTVSEDAAELMRTQGYS
jgi:hypothetical protein